MNCSVNCEPNRKAGRRILLRLLMVLAAIHILSGGSPVRAASYKMSADSAVIRVGETMKLTFLNGKKKVKDVVWSTSNENVASVDSQGIIKGNRAGSAVITAAKGSRKAECIVSVLKQTTQNTRRYNVLILDNSGSMKGVPFKKEKDAAKRFCKTLLASKGANYIALVVLTKDGAAAISCGFSENYKTLSSAIAAQKKANAKTNLNKSLTLAGSLLDSAESGDEVMKNIVLCSDGLCKNGGKLAKGRYTKKDSSKYYQYGNQAYKTDTELKKKGYFVYALGFYQNSKGQNLAFGKKLMKDLASEEKYYQINDIKDYEPVFEEIAKTIVSVRISRTRLTMQETESETLYVTKNGIQVSAEWKSSDPDTASVDAYGKVAAKKKGSCTITAVVDGKSVKCKVNVREYNPFAGGEGTKEDPYQVATLEQLKCIARFPESYFRQIADIDGGGSSFPAMFTEEIPFSGDYDGENHSIGNLSLSEERETGIFAFVGEEGCVHSVRVSHIDLQAGGSVPLGGTLVGKNRGTIRDCSVTDSSVSCGVRTTMAAGGLVGHNTGGLVENCTARNVTVYGNDAGGVVGGMRPGIVRNCRSYAVSVTGASAAGGVVGAGGDCLIENCSADTECTVVSHGAYRGEIVGYQDRVTLVN